MLARLSENVDPVDQVQQARTRLTSQMERNKRLFVLGDMSEREYLAERKRIQSEQASLPATRSQMPDLERAALMLGNFADLWQRATDLEKLKLVHAIVEQSWRKGYQIIAIEPRPAMYTLLLVCQQNAKSDEDCKQIEVVAPGAGISTVIG